ncbi:MAG: hypothetical protein KDH96_01975 [Candidatus Riesia sp.]|nr:hypothetical protein [Candidatus Riesia sp.]
MSNGEQLTKAEWESIVKSTVRALGYPEYMASLPKALPAIASGAREENLRLLKDIAYVLPLVVETYESIPGSIKDQVDHIGLKQWIETYETGDMRDGI